jgi:hypothetical protein
MMAKNINDDLNVMKTLGSQQGLEVRFERNPPLERIGSLEETSLPNVYTTSLAMTSLRGLIGNLE